MKEQVTTLELGKCYRVKWSIFIWYLSVYSELPLTNNSSLTAIKVDKSGISTKCFLLSDSYNEDEYEVQEISKSEFLHELRSERNDINKLIRKMA